jgi:hypothetical protein
LTLTAYLPRFRPDENLPHFFVLPEYALSLLLLKVSIISWKEQDALKQNREMTVEYNINQAHTKPTVTERCRSVKMMGNLRNALF